MLWGMHERNLAEHNTQHMGGCISAAYHACMRSAPLLGSRVWCGAAPLGSNPTSGVPLVIAAAAVAVAQDGLLILAPWGSRALVMRGAACVPSLKPPGTLEGQ